MSVHEPLPRLLLIADGFATGRRGRDVGAVWMATEYAVRDGNVRFVQLRDHAASEHEFSVAAGELAGRLRGELPPHRDLAKDPSKPRRNARFRRWVERGLGIYLVINGRPDVAKAELAGLHVGARGPAVASVREDVSLLGYSAHTPEEAGQAARRGVDYVLFSPIFPTTSKPAHPGVGVEALASAVAAARPVPVYALGGISPERVSACLRAGAHGVAVLSGILDAPDPVAAARAYQSALDAPV